MTLNANHIRELLDASTPGPWKYCGAGIRQRDDDHEYVIDMNRYWAHEDTNRPEDFTLAALAPELATEVLRLHEALSAWIEDERAAETALKNAHGLGNTTTTHTTIINRINHILNGVTND